MHLLYIYLCKHFMLQDYRWFRLESDDVTSKMHSVKSEVV